MYYHAFYEGKETEKTVLRICECLQAKLATEKGFFAQCEKRSIHLAVGLFTHRLTGGRVHKIV